ncbi:pyridoxal phosphate-dependent aminotransferase [bacterium]|nr:pyridoxal phosphate-dependent aminotransferase [bacterium]
MSRALANRTKCLSESKTLVITATANRMRAEGVDVINLSVGEPDFPTPEPIKAAGQAAIENNFTRYTAAQGIIELREAIVAKLKNDNQLTYDPSQIVVTSGAKHALTGSLLAAVNPGDEVLYPVPGWLSYPEMIRIAEGEPIPYHCKGENNFRPDLDELRRLITPKTKAIIVNNPSNPTGAAYTPDEIREIGAVLAEHDIWVISDEIYEKLRYDGKSHLSFAQVDGLFEKTVVINGVSKAFAMTGWRIGYLAAAPELVKAVTKLQSQMTSSCCSISQKAASEAMRNGEDANMRTMIEAFSRRRDMVVDALNQIDGVHCPTPDGAFYAFPDVSAFLGKTVNGHTIANDIDLCQWLLEVKHMALVPGAAFGAEGFIRISFAASDKDLQTGLQRLKDGLEELRG